MAFGLLKRGQRPWRQLSGELVEEEFGAGLLEIFLTHGRAAFEAGINEGGRARHDLRGVNCAALVELVVDARLVFWVQGGHLGLLSVEKLAGHSRLSD